MEELERPRNPLQEHFLRVLGRFPMRPADSPDFRHRREAVVHFRDIAVCFPGIAPRPIDTEAALPRRVFAELMLLVIRAARSSTHPSPRIAAEAASCFKDATRRKPSNAAYL